MSNKKTNEQKLIQYKCNYCGRTEQEKLFDAVSHGNKFSVVRCSCGLIFMNPRPSSEALDDYYDDDYFESSSKEFTSWREFPEDLESEILDLPKVDLAKKGRFLDIGCGIGVYSAYMADKGWKVKGLDISRYCTELGKRERGLDLFCGTLLDAKYPEKYFDFIYMRDVIEHLSEPYETLKEIARILKPDGLFVMTTGNAGSIVSRIRQNNWFYLQEDHVHYFSLPTIEKMLVKAGLRVEKLGNEYCYGRSIAEMRRVGAPRLMIRIPEYILNTRVAPAFYKYLGSGAADLFATTVSLHIRKK